MEKYSIKFNKQINETFLEEIDKKDFNDFEIFLIEQLEESIENNDKDRTRNFINEYLQDSDSKQIEGLIEDNEIYDVYSVFKENIDKYLLDYKYFEKSPLEYKVFSMYDYIILGTKKSIKIALSKLLNKTKEKI